MVSHEHAWPARAIERSGGVTYGAPMSAPTGREGAHPNAQLSFQEAQARYAALAVRVGLNVQAGQRVVVEAAVPAAPFVRLVVEEAYRAGARLVTVLWHDPAVTLARFRLAPRDSFGEVFTHELHALNQAAERGDAILRVEAPDPHLLGDQDPTLVAQQAAERRRRLRPYYERGMRDDYNWSVIQTPSAAWAAQVYPEVPGEQRERRLWDLLFETTRVYEEDPVLAWREHLGGLSRRAAQFGNLGLWALHFQGPGTDLTVGLAHGHRWMTGLGTTPRGVKFVANLPTEEVFTAPHREHVNGHVTASRPFTYEGTTIEGLRVTFRDGLVVQARARTGEALLGRLLETSEAARRLGEVALVPESSPVARQGRVFFNPFFDENAASHLAFGQAYPITIRGGSTMTPEELAAAGANAGDIHEDWMIGSTEVAVDGLREDGTRVAIMRQGEWALP